MIHPVVHAVINTDKEPAMNTKDITRNTDLKNAMIAIRHNVLSTSYGGTPIPPEMYDMFDEFCAKNGVRVSSCRVNSRGRVHLTVWTEIGLRDVELLPNNDLRAHAI
jgi:hypothetical protein